MLTCIYPFQVVLHFLPRIIKWHSKFYLSDYLNRLSEKLGRGQREGEREREREMRKSSSIVYKLEATSQYDKFRPESGSRKALQSLLKGYI